MNPTSKQEASQTLDTLLSASSKELLIPNGHDWGALGEKFKFSSLPAKPEIPPAPQEPTFGNPPREDDPKYAVELKGLDKLLSSRRIKKQQAALDRFERDRRAWNDDRKHMIALFEFAKKKHVEQCATLETDHEIAVGVWKRDFEAHLQHMVRDAS